MKTVRCISFAAACLLGLQSGLYAQDGAAGTPLEDVTRDMKVAANQLSKRTTHQPTQKPQADAIEKIDNLIAALEKERQMLGTGNSAQPTVPANASNIMTGPGGMGDLHGTRNDGDRWGELPDRERDRILQSLTEGFPPHYQAILEAYYKRLAVEKKAEALDEPPLMKPSGDKPAPSMKLNSQKSKLPAKKDAP
jgi:hypothetical protein